MAVRKRAAPSSGTGWYGSAKKSWPLIEQEYHIEAGIRKRGHRHAAWQWTRRNSGAKLRPSAARVLELALRTGSKPTAGAPSIASSDFAPLRGHHNRFEDLATAHVQSTAVDFGKLASSPVGSPAASPNRHRGWRYSSM